MRVTIRRTRPSASPRSARAQVLLRKTKWNFRRFVRGHGFGMRQRLRDEVIVSPREDGTVFFPNIRSDAAAFRRRFLGNHPTEAHGLRVSSGTRRDRRLNTRSISDPTNVSRACPPRRHPLDRENTNPRRLGDRQIASFFLHETDRNNALPDGARRKRFSRNVRARDRPRPYVFRRTPKRCTSRRDRKQSSATMTIMTAKNMRYRSSGRISARK